MNIDMGKHLKFAVQVHKSNNPQGLFGGSI